MIPSFVIALTVSVILNVILFRSAGYWCGRCKTAEARARVAERDYRFMAMISSEHDS